MIRTLPARKPPAIAPDAYVDEAAHVLGEVTVGPRASIWPGAVVRGDENWIRIGAETSIQDNAVCHVTEEHPLLIGDGVTIGHGAILHGCTIGNNARIGMGAIVLDGAVVEEWAMVAAGALVPPGKVIPAGHLAVGVPARVVREMTADERRDIRQNAVDYMRLVDRYYRPGASGR